MADLDLREFTDYDTLARDWHADTLDQHDVTLKAVRERGLINETDPRPRWRLLSQLDDDELLIQLPGSVEIRRS